MGKFSLVLVERVKGDRVSGRLLQNCVGCELEEATRRAWESNLGTRGYPVAVVAEMAYSRTQCTEEPVLYGTWLHPGDRVKYLGPPTRTELSDLEKLAYVWELDGTVTRFRVSAPEDAQ